jgi:hypothetical protein
MADPVNFTRPAAGRIARVVRQVESGDRSGAALTWDRPWDTMPGQPIRFCSWTATWTHAQTTTVTFAPGTNVTATANNVILGVGPGRGWVAKQGTAGWSLVAFDMTQQHGYEAGEIQLLGHDDNAVAQWYSITTCSTATA